MGAFELIDDTRVQSAMAQDTTMHHNATINASINALAVKLETFLELSRVLVLSADEEAAMLDVSADVLLRLRNTPAALTQLGDAKLHRRVDYAIRILRQMRNTVMEESNGAVMAGPIVDQ